MSFKLYMGNPFNKKHETQQMKEITKQLIKRYGKSKEYCYCLANFDYGSPERGNQGQYDMILIFKKSIVILELKGKAGILNGIIDKNHQNTPIEIVYEGDKKESIKMSQIEKEHRYFTSFLSYDFREKRKQSRKFKYRADVLLVFNKITDNNLDIRDEQYSKWFDVCSIDQVAEKIDERTKDHPFTLHPEDIDYIASRFRLKEVDPRDYSLTSRSYSKVFDDIIRVLDLEANESYKTQHILDSLSVKLSSEEITNLSKPYFKPDTFEMMDIDREMKKKGLRALIEMDLHPKKIDDLISERFLTTLLKMVQEIVDAFKDDRDFLDVLSFEKNGKLIADFSSIQNRRRELVDVINEKDMEDKKRMKAVLMDTLLSDYWKEGYIPSMPEEEES